MAERPGHRVVVNYFVALGVTVLVASGLLIGVTVFRFQGESSSSAEVEEFHLPSLSISLDVTSRVAEAVELISGDESIRDDSTVEVTRDLSNAVFGIGEGIAAAAALQAEYDESRFDATIERAGRQSAMLTAGATDGTWGRRQWLDELTALDLTVFQLGRLHSITAESKVESIAQQSDRARTASLVAVPLILVVAGALVARLFVLVSRRLRELDLATENLIASRAQLEQTRKIEALGTLAGGVAHDFNNLLTVILGYTEVAQSRIEPDNPAYRPLQDIQNAGEQAANLTRQLLAFSREDETPSQVVDLNLIIRDSESVLRGLVREDIDLVFEYGPNLGAVIAQSAQIEQVLINLVVNGRDAMPDGGHLLIRTDDVELTPNELGGADGSYARITVEDNGAGMEPDVVERVFEPFFTTKGLGRGTGLGLSTVHGIVSGSDGIILVNSSVGVGTRFEVYFPHVDAPPAEATAEQPGDVNGGTETLLLVEDESQIRGLLASVLRDLGYTVVVAESADHALELCGEVDHPVDLVLTDVVMPGRRGPELVGSLRLIYPDIEVIYMSGYPDSPVFADVQGSGEVLLTKPFKLRQVIVEVRKKLDGRVADHDETTSVSRSDG